MTDMIRDFHAGRRDGIAQIQALIPTDVEKYANIIVGDQTTFISQKDKLDPLVHLARAVTKAHFDCFRAAVGQLAEGQSVYDLTGASTLPTYRRITDGDYNAGVMSAVEDMTALLGTMDGAALFKPFETTRDALDELAHDNDISIKTMCIYNHELLVDTMFMRMYERITRNMKVPKQVVYEETADMPKRRSLMAGFGAALKAQMAPLDRFSNRRQKMPDLWPPLKSQMAITPVFATQTQIAEASAHILTQTQENPASYAEGFLRGVSVLYYELQQIHFDALARGEGYVDHIGHDTGWGRKVAQVALDQFAALRDTMRDALQERRVFGTGQTYEEGVRGAGAFIAQTVQQLGQKLALDSADLGPVNAFETVRHFWLQEVERIVAAACIQPSTGPQGPVLS